MIKFRKYETLNFAIKILVESLQITCLPDDDPIFPEDGVWWVGYDNKQPIAFCVVRPSYQWKDTVYLARSGVLPYWRGKGLQKRMIRIRESYARRNGFVWAITDTTENPPSANSLARVGYQMFEPAKPWALDTSLYWRKKL